VFYNRHDSPDAGNRCREERESFMDTSAPETLVRNRLTRYVSSLRFPWLLALTALIFAADLILPDAIPFVDEMILGLVTALLATMKKRKAKDRR
jgi:hypothetical protein